MKRGYSRETTSRLWIKRPGENVLYAVKDLGSQDLGLTTNRVRIQVKESFEG